jgi:Zn-dependent peptidase ImmA (M78 family)/transcriptional regulator with XRE-family HTH domain
MIGRRLKSARTAAGLSLRALAEAMDHKVSAQAIGKYERNEDMPRSSVLSALARALDVEIDYLLGDGDLHLEGVEFRKSASTSRKEVARIEAKTLVFVEHYLLVEEMLLLPSSQWQPPRSDAFAVSSVDQADAAADALRDVWDLGTDPVPKLAELLEEHGIKIVSVDSPRVDGLAAKVKREGHPSVPVIMIAKGAWAERKRFSLAHELAHQILDVADGVDVEKVANRFAGAFLVPGEVLRQEIGHRRTEISLGELRMLKRRYGVSLQALTYRCKDLGIINRTLYRELFDLYDRNGWRAEPFEEPDALNPVREEPMRFRRLCFRALSEGLIGESRAAELLGMTVRELEKELDAVA